MGVPKDKILALLKEKVELKREVFSKTQEAFSLLKGILEDLAGEFEKSVKAIDHRLTIEYTDTGEFEANFSLADETLLFVMHTNIFTFDSNHEVWKTSYVQEDPSRAYCGKIFIYNFLLDSFRYQRRNDIGYLIARIFVNRDMHFFVEGRRQMGFLYNDFARTVLDRENLCKIVESSLLYSLDFDPFTPPYERVNEVNVGDVLEANLQARIATGKRLGFRFEGDKNITG